MAEPDLSGHIGLGAREHLLEELAQLDEQRARVAREQGRLMLQAARAWAVESGVDEPSTRQRNGTLVETLVELEGEMRLLVIGKRGETAHQDSGHLGSNLVRTARSRLEPRWPLSWWAVSPRLPITSRRTSSSSSTRVSNRVPLRWRMAG